MSQNRYLFYAAQNYSYAILRPLQKAIRERGDDVAWFLAGKEINPDYLRNDEVRLTSIRQAKSYMPRAVFAPGNIVPDFFPGIKVGLFHGFHTRKRASDNHNHYKIRGFFDLYCTQGPDTTKKFQQLAVQHGFFRVVETGWPKLDPMFSENFAEVAHSKPIVLYSSTFSRRATSAPQLLETIEKLSRNGRYQWRVTFHPKMDKTIVDAYKNIQNENLQFIETDNVIPLLIEADVMLCDTSSILQEFLVLGKPAVTFKNKQPEACMIDIQKPEELIPALDKAISRPPELIKQIQSYSEGLHPYRDGQSSFRVLDAIDWFAEEGYKNLRPKPFNLVRKIKIRIKLGYYWK
jgi:CDP-glycerol glycerophosphotransferase (TagB/SpsB family)